MSKKGSFLCALAVMAVFYFAQAQSDSGGARIVLPEGLVFKPHLYAHFEAGQIASGNLNSWGAMNINGADGRYPISHVWTEDAILQIGFTTIYKERLKMVASLGASMAFGYPIIFDNGHVATKTSNSFIYFDEAYAKYHFGSAEFPWLMGEIGYFKFKYNPDVRNLGEYLFRTGTYPIYFDMNFDFPAARMLGAHLQSNLFNSLTLDALLSSSTVFPTMNWSFSALFSYDIAALRFATIGAGVDFSHLLDVYSSNAYSKPGDPTTPKNSAANYQYIKDNGDTAWYTFQGTKIMARLNLNPQAFFKWRFLGKEDLRLYAEADIIGFENYPDTGLFNGVLQTAYPVAPSYNNRLEKMPVAVGLNLPTYPLFAYGIAPELLLWKLQDKYDVVPQVGTTLGCLVVGAALTWLQEKYHINSQLDVLNLELEYFGAQYYNDDLNIFGANSNPLPNDVSYWFDPNSGAPKKSQVKWSLYAKKTLLNGHFAIAGQVGLDHTRLSNFSYDSYQLRSELCVTRTDWHWVLKTSWMF